MAGTYDAVYTIASKIVQAEPLVFTSQPTSGGSFSIQASNLKPVTEIEASKHIYSNNTKHL
jgi:hypothetical protein